MKDTLHDIKVKAFPSFVEKVANDLPQMQQTISKLEKALLALKADNNCDNNAAVMLAGIEFQANANSLLHNLSEVGQAHHDTNHNGEESGIEVVEMDASDLPPELHAILSELFFGRKGRGKPH